MDIAIGAHRQVRGWIGSQNKWMEFCFLKSQYRCTHV